MVKLVVLVDSMEFWQSFESQWPRFLRAAEKMPGLQREATCRVDRVLYGEAKYTLIHELFFDSVEAVYQAMASPPGAEAGQVLQEMTRGQMTLLIADHKEDELENIRKFQEAEEGEGGKEAA